MNLGCGQTPVGDRKGDKGQRKEEWMQVRGRERSEPGDESRLEWATASKDPTEVLPAGEAGERS